MKKRKFSFAKTICRLIAFINEKDRSVFMLFGIYTVSEACLPFIPVLMPKILLDEILKGDIASLSRIWMIVSVFFAISAVVGMLSRYSGSAIWPKLMQLRNYHTTSMIAKYIRMDYKYTEDASVLDETNRMKSLVLGGPGVEGIYRDMFETPAQLFPAVTFVIIIGRLSQ